MEGKAVITIETSGDGEVSLKTEFDPEIELRPGARNPISHQVAMKMLEAAISDSEDPEGAMDSARFGHRDEDLSL